MYKCLEIEAFSFNWAELISGDEQTSRLISNVSEG